MSKAEGAGTVAKRLAMFRPYICDFDRKSGTDYQRYVAPITRTDSAASTISSVPISAQSHSSGIERTRCQALLDIGVHQDVEGAVFVDDPLGGRLFNRRWGSVLPSLYRPGVPKRSRTLKKEAPLAWLAKEMSWAFLSKALPRCIQ